LLQPRASSVEKVAILKSTAAPKRLRSL